MPKQFKVIDRDSFEDERPIREIELAVVERLQNPVTNPLGWRPWGRDAEGNALIGCIVSGPLNLDSKPTERICTARISKSGLEYLKEEIRDA